MDNNIPITSVTVRDKLSALWQRVWSFIKAKKYLYPSFLLPVGILLVVYAIIGVFPFGERSILTLDMNAQYIYYFEQLRDILTGNGSLIYTWERVLGGEFLGFYAYYAASPLAFLLILCPPSLMVEGVMLMMVLKCGLSGLCFAIYLDRSGRKRNVFSYTMFSTMYAFCAYAMAYQSNTMWQDALMWLPLLTLGIEAIIKNGRFKLYTIMLALIIWSNYYIGYMVCIYTLLYFICYICAHKNDEINALREKYHILKSLARIAVCTIVALMMVSMIILCAYYSISFGKSSGEMADMSFDLRFDFLDLISKFFIGSYDTVRPAGLPNVYCGILALFMLPVYFLTKKISVREKVSYGVLALIFIASMSVDALDLAWHGFQMPVWLNYRYSFMLSFIVLLMAYKGFELFTELEYKGIIQIGAMLMLLLLVIQKTVLLPRYEGKTETPTMPDYELVWISFVFIFVYLVVLYYKKRETIKRASSIALLCIVGFEACVSGIINWGEEVNDVGWAKREVYRESIDSIEPTVDYILENDTSFYRMEKTLFRKPNENFALDIRGLTASTSTFNRDVMNLMKYCGFNARSHWSKYFEGNEVVDSIFGIKYVISNDDIPVSNLYYAKDGKNDLLIYENPYALSIAYPVSSQMKELDAVHTVSSPLQYLEYLTSGLAGEDELKLFQECYYSLFERDNCSKGGSASTDRFTRADSNRKASFTYAITAYSTGSIYMYLKPNGTNQEATYYVNGVESGKVLGDETNRVQNIGSFKAGETVYVKVEFDSDKVAINTSAPLFSQLVRSEFERVFGALNEGEMQISDYSDTRFEGTIVAEDDEIVMTTIPYDKYWKVYVDGERVESYEVLDALLAFDITPGEHEIELKYSSTMFNVGVGVGLFGLALFIVMCVFEKAYRRKMGFDAIEDTPIDAPEGEGSNGEGEIEPNVKIDNENITEEDENI
ncbi:MAG: YfhO family protein [Clostridia bacterium]|nr:YfhO family protein [Clostridia bacterium]